jgi:hypothetical protein
MATTLMIMVLEVARLDRPASPPVPLVNRLAIEDIGAKAMSTSVCRIGRDKGSRKKYISAKAQEMAKRVPTMTPALLNKLRSAEISSNKPTVNIPKNAFAEPRVDATVTSSAGSFIPAIVIESIVIYVMSAAELFIQLFITLSSSRQLVLEYMDLAFASAAMLPPMTDIEFPASYIHVMTTPKGPKKLFIKGNAKHPMLLPGRVDI